MLGAGVGAGTISVARVFALSVFSQPRCPALATQCRVRGRHRGVPAAPKPEHFGSRMGTSLVAQWLRIRLPMQGTRVQALVGKDPMCRGATEPVRHNY